MRFVDWVIGCIPDPNPRLLVAFHFLMMVVWGLLLIPTLLWWKQSILWVAIMSIYAAWVGHFSAWDAARAGVEAKKAAEGDSPAT